MRIVGVVAEYNPFHNGHAYLLKEAKRVAGADVCVVAMSGDFVQRGEMAILDKWKRAEIALRNGADVVIEIPTAFALSDAGRYGRAGVSLLEGFGCDAVAFGSESGDVSVIKKVASNLAEYEGGISEKVAELRKRGLSYPKARQAAYDMVVPGSDKAAELAALESPNDILAIEYVKAAENLDVYAVKRKGAGYSDGIDDSEAFQSATGIRNAISAGLDISRYVPEESLRELENLDADKLCAAEVKLFELVKYSLLTRDAAAIDGVPSGGEGLASRLKSAVMSSDSLSELVEFAKSKRYTYTRISRLVMQNLIGIARGDVEGEIGYARVLGFNQTGRKALSYVKKCESNSIRIITNVNKEAEELEKCDLRLLALDEQAVNIYNLLSNKSLYSNADRVVRPIIVQK